MCVLVASGGEGGGKKNRLCGGKRDEHASPSFVFIFVLNSIRLGPFGLLSPSLSGRHREAAFIAKAGLMSVVWGR